MAISLMEKLMKLDREKMMEIPTAKMRVKHLSEVAGENVEITLKALSGNLYTELASGATDKSGLIDAEKIYDVHARVAVAGCIEPDLKDKELMKYYNAETPSDLAKILFQGGELVKVSEKIGALSGFVKEDERDNKKKDGLDYDSIKN